MDKLNITSAQYQQVNDTNVSIAMQLDGDTTVTYCVPLDPANTHYAEILKQVEEKTLTIKDAE